MAGGSSSSNNATDTTQVDRRIANDSGLVIGGDVGKFDASTTVDASTVANGNTANSNNTTTNTTTITTLDGGAIHDAMGVVTAGTSAIAGGYSKLVDGATKIFTTASDNQRDTFSDLLGASTSANAAALSAGREGLTRAYSGLDSLVNVATQMFKSNESANDTLRTSVAAAYQTAQAEKSGSLDNKTIVILGVVAAAAAVAAVVAKRKG